MSPAPSRALVVATLVLGAVRLVVAQPSVVGDDYVLLAEERIKTKGLDVESGDVGVNASGGVLQAPRFLRAPTSTVASDRVRFGVGATDFTFGSVYANTIERGSLVPNLFATPIVPDLGAACGFPGSFPACDDGARVTVPAGSIDTLTPGVYGALRVRSTSAFPTTLTLAPGIYVFCDVKVGREATVRFSGPATVYVRGSLASSVRTYFGPAPPGFPEHDLRVHVAGRLVKFTRQSSAHAHVCAPSASLRMSQGGRHSGSYVANFIRTEEVVLTLASPSGAFVAAPRPDRTRRGVRRVVYRRSPSCRRSPSTFPGRSRRASSCSPG